MDWKQHDHFGIMFFNAFPDAQFSVEDMIAEGDKVVSRYTGRGTHKGAWLGISPSGKQIVLTGNEIHRIINGKIVERWTVFDDFDLVRIVGGIPAAGN